MNYIFILHIHVSSVIIVPIHVSSIILPDIHVSSLLSGVYVSSRTSKNSYKHVFNQCLSY